MDIRIHTTFNTQKDLEKFGHISEQKEEYFAENDKEKFKKPSFLNFFLCVIR